MEIKELKLKMFFIAKEDTFLIIEFLYSYSQEELLCLANTRFRSEFRYLKAAPQVFTFMERITQKLTSNIKSKRF